ncbi:MAG TPA: hypothetical protein VGH42_02355 [Verrucomicrobiae bacterium]|jgi:hypothetical protein
MLAPSMPESKPINGKFGGSIFDLHGKHGYFETSAKPSNNRSGVSTERRKTLEIKECDFLPKAATPPFAEVLFCQNASPGQMQKKAR